MDCNTIFPEAGEPVEPACPTGVWRLHVCVSSRHTSCVPGIVADFGIRRCPEISSEPIRLKRRAHVEAWAPPGNHGYRRVATARHPGRCRVGSVLWDLVQRMTLAQCGEAGEVPIRNHPAHVPYTPAVDGGIRPPRMAAGGMLAGNTLNSTSQSRADNSVRSYSRTASMRTDPSRPDRRKYVKPSRPGVAVSAGADYALRACFAVRKLLVDVRDELGIRSRCPGGHEKGGAAMPRHGAWPAISLVFLALAILLLGTSTGCDLGSVASTVSSLIPTSTGQPESTTTAISQETTTSLPTTTTAPTSTTTVPTTTATTVPATTVPTTTTVPAERDGGTAWWVVILILGVAAVLAIVLVVAVARRRTRADAVVRDWSQQATNASSQAIMLRDRITGDLLFAPAAGQDQPALASVHHLIDQLSTDLYRLSANPPTEALGQATADLRFGLDHLRSAVNLRTQTLRAGGEKENRQSAGLLQDRLTAFDQANDVFRTTLQSPGAKRST